MEPATLIDILERARAHYLAAIDFTRTDLPQSAAAEELAATRLINRAILDLTAIKKK